MRDYEEVQKYIIDSLYFVTVTVSRGKQCSAFMSFSALLRAHSLALAVVQWRSQTNYRILEEGDRMYLNALDNQVNLYSEMIPLNYVPAVYPRIKLHTTNFTVYKALLVSWNDKEIV